MMDAPTVEATVGDARSGAPAAGNPLVLLPSLPETARQELVDRLEAAAGQQPLRLRTPDAVEDGAALQQLDAEFDSEDGWLLTPAHYAAAASSLQAEGGDGVLLLGPEASSLDDASLARMVRTAAAPTADICVPRYELPPQAGLVNAAILYPVTRSLYGIPARYPLPLDVVLTANAAQRLAATARRQPGKPASNIFWPIAEAAAAKLTVAEIRLGPRQVPAPPSADLQSALAEVVGSLFADAERKAVVWQRIRGDIRQPSPSIPGLSSMASDQPEVGDLISNFRHAYANLQELWSLVLPPQSLLQLKRLAQAPDDNFRMADELWARIVYDFLLAFRLRTMNGGHLLGAMTPLYLAWVASHLQQSDGDTTAAEAHIEAVARAFVADKPYLVARWRWPDRFNP